ncbi:MAG: GRP family sugar transporter [Acidobacteriia bacterium]|nr:GRP family sugar transporter [Terriglobia bacterium]
MNPLSFVTVFTFGELGMVFTLAAVFDGGVHNVMAGLVRARPALFWLFLGGFCWVVGDLFQNYAAKYIGIARGIPLSNTNQLWGLAWGVLVFGELAGQGLTAHVLVFTGSLIMIVVIALANDKAELASVLSHEMGHVIARHAAIREEQAKQVAIISHVVNDVLSDPQVGALALAKSKLTLAAFSRAQEFEADGIGVGIAARAGFDPYGASRFLTDMQRNADLKASSGGADPRALDFLSSHPATPERVKNALANARQFSGPGTGERDRTEYLGSLAGLIYGEDPSEGFARGRHFLHPKLGFTFVAPPGFTLDNTAQAVLGLKDGGNEALRLDVVSVPAEQSLPDYLKSGWMTNVDAASVEEFTINGFPAAAATATGDQWSFRLFAVRFGSDVYRFIFAAKTMNAQIDRSFRESVASFRRMSLKESEQIRPMHLKIITAAPGDTVEKLARHMAISDHAVERFRVLNGLSAADRIKPGEKLKIVVE